MALVLFFVPDPARGVAEMRRVVRPGGMISAYLWDVLEPGGFPLSPVQDELCAIGAKPVLPPRSEVSRMNALRALWTDAGLTVNGGAKAGHWGGVKVGQLRCS